MTKPVVQPQVTHFACTACARTYDPSHWRGLCECGRPLAVRYDLAAIAPHFRPADLLGRTPTLWRYREVLPLATERAPVTLGEGFTPLAEAPALAHELGVDELWIKDEAPNPTGSFKARGLCLAVTMAQAYGARVVALPSAGNAGGALAAYAARAGIEAHVFVPEDCPRAFVQEAQALGAHVTLVPGFITDAGRRLREVAGPDWFDLSTLKEPFRVEGKKTMGYELAEQFGFALPDVIVYPTGGGTGLVGMAKAFDEMEALGWIAPGRRPRMVSVQMDGCAPIPRAFAQGKDAAEPWVDPETLAAGLRVPVAVGDRWMLEVLHATRGCAVAVSEDGMLDDTLTLSRALGVLAAPEGGAALAGLRKLAGERWVGPGDRVVVFNTGSGLKYGEAIAAALARERARLAREFA
jgi:threonine synthase